MSAGSPLSHYEYVAYMDESGDQALQKVRAALVAGGTHRPRSPADPQRGRDERPPHAAQRPRAGVSGFG